MTRAWWARLDTDHLVLLVTLASVFAMAARVPVDPDGWWHLAGGRYIVQRSSIPHTDPFSHTRAGASWIDNGWLAQIGLYFAYRWLGYVGLGLVVALGAVLAMALLWAQMDGGPFVRAFIIVLAATVSGPVWTVRPHLATYVLTAALGFILQRWRSGHLRALWFVPPLFVLWGNLHAGYMLGLGLLGLVVIGEALDRLSGADRGRFWRQLAYLAMAGAIAFALVPLNAYGFAMWGYPLYNAGQEVARRYITEWASPDFHRLMNQPFAALLLLTLLAVGLSQRRGRWAELLPVTAFAYLTLRSQRAMGLFAVVTAPVLSHHVASGVSQIKRHLLRPRPSRSMTRGRAAVNGVLVLLVTGAALVRAGEVWRKSMAEGVIQELGFPADAVTWIEQKGPPRQLYNPYRWGGYLIWRLFPDYQVFVDGRADMYGDPFLLEYVELTSAAPGWEEMLASHDVCTALVQAGGALSSAMAGSPDWEHMYEDKTAAIYIRSSARCASVDDLAPWKQTSIKH
jgi:hypothetical protein